MTGPTLADLRRMVKEKREYELEILNRALRDFTVTQSATWIEDQEHWLKRHIITR